MQRGVIYGILAGALWGTVFLAPRLLADFSPWLLSSGRYMMYGAVSLLAFVPIARAVWPKLTTRDVLTLLRLALTGNLVYYVFLAQAVHRVGIAPTSLIIGVLPVTVTLAGRRDHGAIPLSRLTLPLGLVLAGIACINVDVFFGAGATGLASDTSLGSQIVGLLCATGALASWTWFAVENARYLQHNPRFTGHEWSTLWGIATGLLGLALGLIIVALPAGTIQPALPASRWHLFWALNLILAIGASWLGNGLWNAAAKRLPLTLSGQMIVFETLFALVYGFIYDGRFPRGLEIAAIALLAIGVSWSVRLHSAEDPMPHRIEDEAEVSTH
ncbi:MAG TPA: DMT family transporter [Pararobbsia sp.]|jgi:drug/metabolite transporter (DMT)-like permease|nr:DMT family transporter [Pararobbsia sp.]